MPRSYFTQRATSFTAAAFALTLALAPDAYTQMNTQVALGSAIGTGPSSAGLMVAMPVSGTQEQATKQHKRVRSDKSAPAHD